MCRKYAWQFMANHFASNDIHNQLMIRCFERKDFCTMNYIIHFEQHDINNWKCRKPQTNLHNKQSQFVQKNEKLLLWWAQVTGRCGGWTSSFENLISQLRNAPKRLRKTEMWPCCLKLLNYKKKKRNLLNRTVYIKHVLWRKIVVTNV